MNKKWSINEENYLKENVNTLTDEKIAEELTKRTGKTFTMLSVRKKRQKLGLKKAQGRGYCHITQDTLDKFFYN